MTRSTMNMRVVGSIASGPEAWSFRAAARSANGLSSSFQGRTSASTLRVSRIEGSSKYGVTTTTRPSAGISAAVVRSERHQRMPVKYSSEAPDSTRKAPIFCRCISPCSLDSRVPCSWALMGSTLCVIELRPAACAGAAARAPTATAAPAAVSPKKSRRRDHRHV